MGKGVDAFAADLFLLEVAQRREFRLPDNDVAGVRKIDHIHDFRGNSLGNDEDDISIYAKETVNLTLLVRFNILTHILSQHELDVNAVLFEDPFFLCNEGVGIARPDVDSYLDWFFRFWTFGDTPCREGDYGKREDYERRHLFHSFISPEKMRPQDAFLLAASREKKSHELYENLAAMHPEGPVKDLLKRLAGEELSHKEKVEYLYANTAFPQTDGG